MTSNKVISSKALESNLEFYLYMKRIFGNDFNLTKIADKLLPCFEKNGKTKLANCRTAFLQILLSELDGKKTEKYEEYERLTGLWKSKESPELFKLALYMTKVKAKLKSKIDELLTNKTYSGDKLSLVYDSKSSLSAYEARILTAILSKETMEKLQSGQWPNYFGSISKKTKSNILKLIKTQNKKIDLISCFLPIMIESVNQSIISNAGGSYEDRVEEKLISIGIEKENITKYDHSETGSIEHDFIFKYKNKKWGISAKRTLRERYKQYVNLLQNNETDFMLAITLGTDLSEAKAKTIVSFGVILFISPEVYANNKELQRIRGVYSTSQLTKTTFDKIMATSV